MGTRAAEALTLGDYTFMSKIPIRIVGVHRYPVTEELFRKTLEYQWGEDLAGAEMKEAESHVREHFENLYVLEIFIDDQIEDLNWSEVTQEIPDQPKENWQVPYDEQLLDDTGRRWAFFFHFMDWRKPLLTSFGPITLPKPTELPRHLSFMKYESP